MNKFYHISLADDPIIHSFHPRVPEDGALMEDEDCKTARICVSDSIDNCLSSVPWGSSGLLSLMTEEGISIPIRVYEFDSSKINSNNIVFPDTLYKQRLVPDAKETNEFWIINQKLTPTNIFYISITSYKEVTSDSNFIRIKDTKFNIVDISDYTINFSIDIPVNSIQDNINNIKSDICRFLSQKKHTKLYEYSISESNSNTSILVESPYENFFIQNKDIESLKTYLKNNYS